MSDGAPGGTMYVSEQTGSPPRITVLRPAPFHESRVQPLSLSMMEHRWGERADIDIPVQLIGPSQTLAPGRLKNFSTSGAFVETDLEQAVMTSLTVILPGVGPTPGHSRIIPGYVARHDRGGIGMGWWKLAPVTAAQLVAIRAAMEPGTTQFSPSRMYY